ncbi:MFS family permease [Actinoplanes octamycinicus]|uniref:MFS family permease n=1 Tax=Actinoplanes octamycinicus TaxID=135948 RepID=A0A7W7H4E0_9ACTN|nr:MFS transporter [Actinoplanes octamycinicus]MBB4743452.1 MFS family permease [Actinoplanes octamycinicus]GIE63449.1 MFS transporter [Actinoplanes octamycinicus]
MPRDFTRYLIAAVAAKWGVNLAKVAIPLVAITSLGAGPGAAGSLAAAGTAPFLLLGLPAGAWLDRIARRPVMIAMDLVRFALLGSVPLVAAASALTMPYLWVVVFLNGVATVFFDVAMQSHLPDLLGGADGGRLVRANGRLATVDQLALIGGPALAGWLIGLWTASTVLVVTAFGYLWSALWIRRIRQPEPRPAAAPRSLVAEVREGLSFVRRDRTLRAIATAGALVNFAIAGVVAMLPLLLEQGRTLSLFLSAGGVGGLLAAVVAKRLPRGRSVIATGLAIVPAALLLPFAGRPVPVALAAAAWAAVIFKVGYDSVVLMSFRQLVTPPALLGRVNGTLRVIFSGALTLGAGTAGLIGEQAGPRTAAGVACAALALVWVPIARSPLRSTGGADGRTASAGAARRADPKRARDRAWLTSLYSGSITRPDRRP